MPVLENYYLKQATAKEKKILSFVLKHPAKALELDIYELADTCSCSAATITRISQKAGFKGYKEMKLALAEELGFKKRQPKNEPLSQSTEAKVSERILYEDMKAIQGTYELLDDETVTTVCAKMKAASSIYLFGIGASYLVMKDLAMKCIRIHKAVWHSEDLHLQTVMAGNMEPGDLCFIASYSGQTREMIEIAKLVKAREGVICAITQYSVNQLAQLADYNLYVPKIEELLRVGASSSRISQLAVVDVLFHVYLRMEDASFMERIQRSKNLLAKDEDQEMK